MLMMRCRPVGSRNILCTLSSTAFVTSTSVNVQSLLITYRTGTWKGQHCVTYRIYKHYSHKVYIHFLSKHTPWQAIHIHALTFHMSKMSIDRFHILKMMAYAIRTLFVYGLKHVSAGQVCTCTDKCTGKTKSAYHLAGRDVQGPVSAGYYYSWPSPGSCYTLSSE